MLGKIIKNILIFEVLFSLFLYSEYVNLIPPKPGDTYRNYVQINKSKDEIYMLDSKKLWNNYDKWNKLNTHIYTYISTALYENTYILLFIKNNKIVKSLNIPNKNSYKYSTQAINDYYKTYIKLTISIPHIVRRKKDLYNYTLDGKFDLLGGYNNYDIRVEYEKKYHYLSSINIAPRKHTVYKSHGSAGISTYSYGLMMLPKGTKYTDDIVKKILNKYKQAWECEKKLPASQKTNNEQNRTMLEKAVGKEKLECLDKYLIWDENESK